MERPHSVLFCCDHNAVRSPMAEALMKRLYGLDPYVQSAGVIGDRDVDAFSIAVCHEIGVELDRHRTRSLDEMADLGERIDRFDLVVAMTPASRAHVEGLPGAGGRVLEYWPMPDPTACDGPRDARLDSYRAVRDAIRARLLDRFGPPAEDA